MSKKSQFLSLPAGLGLVALALLALGSTTRTEVPPGAGEEHQVVRDRIHKATIPYPLTSFALVSSPTWTATGENDDDTIGWSDGGTCIASAGDVNGDGYTEILIDAPGAPGGTYRGQVYLYVVGGVQSIYLPIVVEDLFAASGPAVDNPFGQQLLPPNSPFPKKPEK